MLKAKILVPIIALGVLATGATLWSTGVVKAEGNGNSDTIVQKLADKLGIDQGKVSSAMDQIHEERQAEMQAKMKTKLDTAVQAGTITQDQENAILAKQTEMQQKHEQERKDYQTWLSDNSLDEDTIRDIGVGGLGGGGMRGHGPF